MIKEFENLIRRIEKMIKSEEDHLEYLMDIRIKLINKRYSFYELNVNEMIITSEKHLEHYQQRLEEYKQYKDKLEKV